MKNWEVLKDKKIIEILIGNIVLVDDFFYEYKMPYLTGLEICKLSSKMGFKQDYDYKNTKSRWIYMYNLLDFLIECDKVNLLFREIFSLKRFKDIKVAGDYRESSELYYLITNNCIFKINETLYFEKCHIEYNLETWQFSLIDDENNLLIESQNLDDINSDYIKRLKMEIKNTIKNEDFDSTITKSRTLLEEVMRYGIEQKNVEVKSKGNIDKLIAQFKTLYKMHESENQDKRINSLISGLFKTIHSISEMRDLNSDSHGAGSTRIKIKKHHAILYANSAITTAEFLISVIENSING